MDSNTRARRKSAATGPWKREIAGEDGGVKLTERQLPDALEVLQNAVKMLLVQDALRKIDPQMVTSGNSIALEDIMLGASLVADPPDENDYGERFLEVINLVLREVRQYIDVIAGLGNKGTIGPPE